MPRELKLYLPQPEKVEKLVSKLEIEKDSGIDHSIRFPRRTQESQEYSNNADLEPSHSHLKYLKQLKGPCYYIMNCRPKPKEIKHIGSRE